MAEPVPSAAANAEQADERLYLASQWRLMWRRLGRHRVALAGGVVVLLFYLTMCLGAEFFATHTSQTRFKEFSSAPPSRIRVVDAEGRLHLPLLGVAQPCLLLLFGTDELGRDLYSRTLYGGRVPLSIGLVGVAVGFCSVASWAGCPGSTEEPSTMPFERVIEFLLSIATIPLWMALAAAVPIDWPPLRVYFGITMILSIIGWTALARVVRGKLISTREEDFVVAAQIAGSTERKIIVRHLLPSFLSYLIVDLTLSIPRMILGETALSFLGLGLRPPVVSWGVLLNQAQNVKAVALHPWMLIPAAFVIVSVLAFNLLGDGLRDAADPYASH